MGAGLLCGVATRRFTLLDTAYFDALVDVVVAFERAELPLALVGGGASQAWIASLRTEGGARRLSDEASLRSALRRTRDLDFATRTDEPRALTILNDLAHGARGSAHVLGPRALRLGDVSIALTIQPSDLSGMAALYDVFLDGRSTIRLRAGAVTTAVPVVSLPHLFVTKLTRRGDKAKDLLDVTELWAAAESAGAAVDVSAVRRMLQDRPDALALLDELEQDRRDG